MENTLFRAVKWGKGAFEMSSILVCTSSEKNTDVLASLLRSFVNADISIAENADGIRLHLEQAPETDLVIINSPLKNEQGAEVAAGILERYSVPVMLVTGQETADRAGQSLSVRGIAVVSRPVDKKVFASTVHALLSTGALVKSLRSRNSQLQDKLDEMKLVNRAKAMLMSNLRMTEAQAHRYIEKQAMDLRQSRRNIAQNILKTYYNR